MAKATEPYPPLEDVWLTPDACLGAAWVMLNTLTVNPDTRLYFYVALELRLAIERILRDVLVVISPNRLTRREWELYRAKDLNREIRRLRPDFDARWEFVRELLRGRRPPVSLPHLELKAMTNIYGRLGSFLHSPGSPFTVIDAQDWKDQLEDFISEAYEYLVPFRKAYKSEMPRGPVFDQAVEWAYRQYKRGRMDATQVRGLGRRLSGLL